MRALPRSETARGKQVEAGGDCHTPRSGIDADDCKAAGNRKKAAAAIILILQLRASSLIFTEEAPATRRRHKRHIPTEASRAVRGVDSDSEVSTWVVRSAARQPSPSAPWRAPRRAVGLDPPRRWERLGRMALTSVITTLSLPLLPLFLSRFNASSCFSSLH